MPQPNYSFTSLAGVPTHYAREPIASYGTPGVSHKFYCVQSTAAKLDTMFNDLWARCPLGRAEVITSAGAHVEKPGWHGEGKAFDLDAIFWNGRAFVTKRFPSDAKFYLGVESVLRRHFGTVLAYSYNPDHEDHFHLQDDGVAVGFSEARRTCVLFLQNALKHLRGVSLNVSGAMDTTTGTALSAWLTELGIANINSPANYTRFLDAVQAAGFGAAGPGPIVFAGATRTDLLRYVYASIEEELGETPARKRVETALTAFAQTLPAELLNETVVGGSNKPATGPGGAAGTFTVKTNLKTTVSQLSAKQIDDFFLAQPKKNQSLAGIGEPVIAAAKKYGINATYIVAHAILESGWGNSKIAREKNNLFGWSAFDSSPFSSATGFPTRADCIDFVMGRVNDLYLDPAGKYYHTGPILGAGYQPNGYGMNYNYATADDWGPQIAKIAVAVEAKA